MKLFIDKYQRMQFSCMTTFQLTVMNKHDCQSGKSFWEKTHGSNFTEKTQPGFVSSPTCPCKPS